MKYVRASLIFITQSSYQVHIGVTRVLHPLLALNSANFHLIIHHQVSHLLSHISNTSECSLFVHNCEVKQSICSALSSVPSKLTPDSLVDLLNLVDKLSICAGQPDNHYIKMVSAKRGLLKSQDGSTMADVDDYASVKMNGYLFSKTIRINKCELLIHGVKCHSCSTYNNRWLRRSSADISDCSSHANVQYMNTPEKKQKIAKLKKQAKSAEVDLQKLKVKLKELTQNQGEIIDGAFHDDLFGIMQENNEEVKKKYLEGSFQRLFWEEQINAARVKNSRQIRWHLLII